MYSSFLNGTGKSIGLLKPTKITEAGYRLYDNTALDRLLHILMFRELQIPLKEIKSILDLIYIVDYYVM